MDEIVTINTIVDLSQGNNQRFDLAKGEISPETNIWNWEQIL